MSAQTLEEFTTEAMREVQGFHAAYMKRHIANPEQYPLSLPESNAGLWLEFLVQYMTTGEC